MTSAPVFAALVGTAIVLALAGYAVAVRDERPHADVAVLWRALRVRRRLLAMPVAAAVVMVALVVAWRSRDVTVLYQLRTLVLLAALFPLAVIDLKRHRVPNPVLLVLLGVRVVLYAVEAVVDWPSFRASAVAELVLAVVVLCFFVLVRAIHRGGIGMGDVKLFALVPLFLGPQMALASIFASLVVSFLVSLWLLLSHRGSRTDSFPLVPCVLVGTVAAIGLTTVMGVLS